MYLYLKISDFEQFLEGISKEKFPKYLIINLDQWMFNEYREKNVTTKTKDTWARSFQKIPNFSTLLSVWDDLLSKKYNINPLNVNENITQIGINSVYNNTGYRNDGSLFYGKQIGKLLSKDTSVFDYNFNDTYDRISKGRLFMEYGDKIDFNAITSLEKLLFYCKSNNVEVIAILPPLADKINEKLLSSGKYAYFTSIYSTSLKVFKKYDFELYDFSSLNSCNSNENEIIDGLHGSEVIYLKILIKMLEDNSVLNKVTNLNKLKIDLSKALNSYEVYGN